MKKPNKPRTDLDAAAVAALDRMDQAATTCGRDATTVRRALEHQAAQLEDEREQHAAALKECERAMANADATWARRCADLEARAVAAEAKLRKIAGQLGGE